MTSSPAVLLCYFSIFSTGFLCLQQKCVQEKSDTFFPSRSKEADKTQTPPVSWRTGYKQTTFLRLLFFFPKAKLIWNPFFLLPSSLPDGLYGNRRITEETWRLGLTAELSNQRPFRTYSFRLKSSRQALPPWAKINHCDWLIARRLA